MRHHAIGVAAPRHLVQSASPMLLDRDGADFVPTLLADLADAGARDSLRLSQARARAGGNVLKLFQPIQRRFHLALIEAWCQAPGTPRLDPASVEAAGLVVRRVRGHLREGWMRAGDRLRGWVPVDQLGGPDADPLPAVRDQARATGVAGIDRLLRAAAISVQQPLEEDVTPMFVAPPDVCTAAGRTVYYGTVPTASSENATAPEPEGLFDGFAPTSQAFINHLQGLLRGTVHTFPELPGGATHFDSSFARDLKRLAKLDRPRDGEDPEGASEGGDFWRFQQLLQQVAVEFDAFGEGAAAQALRVRLQTIVLEYPRRPFEPVARTTNARDFLREAVRVLLDGQAGSVEMPRRSRLLGTPQRNALLNALGASMRERLAQVRGRPGRFDEPGARYVVRAFVRLKPRDGCPAKTVWSAESEPFVIAPWYEGAGGDPVQIALPDLTDRNLLKALKPNVSFVVPEKLADLLQTDGADLLDGKKNGGKLGVQWICSFSIPIITFCAFIVLNIFLSLFDLFFRWMLYIKICLPFPKKEGG